MTEKTEIVKCAECGKYLDPDDPYCYACGIDYGKKK